MIVQDVNQVYLYRPLSPEVEKFATVDEAMASWNPSALLPTKDDLYYSRD
ncbi:MAG: hypothetical protein K6347_08340 [Campylobacterales bacterium]